MCFHNSLFVDAVRIESRYNANFIPGTDWQPIYHVAAFNLPAWPIIANEAPSVIQFFQWGLIPFFIKNKNIADDIRVKTLNARIETLHQKKSFYISAKNKLCLIPSTGFFEWQQIGNNKQPWFIRLADEEIFSIAGIWDVWNDPFTGTQYYTFSLITREAVGIMKEIHNTKQRMPFILPKSIEKEWLFANTPEKKEKLLKQSNNIKFNAYKVSHLVGKRNINTNVPEVIKKID
jgi:putative SOS response-associated peptidase YedK